MTARVYIRKNKLVPDGTGHSIVRKAGHVLVVDRTAEAVYRAALSLDVPEKVAREAAGRVERGDWAILKWDAVDFPELCVQW